jgi:hypothetical protein
MKPIDYGLSIIETYVNGIYDSYFEGIKGDLNEL